MNEYLKLISAMFIFGTIGIFATSIPLSSPLLACTRGLLGSLFMLAVILIKKEVFAWSHLKANAWVLLLSGTAIGFNWIFLFEAYHYTTVAVATLCYYMAPIFVILLSPLVLKEKLTTAKMICTIAAVCGAVLISGALGDGVKDFTGVTFGLSAAALYCSVILLNKKITGMETYEKSFVQLGIAAFTMLLYSLGTQDFRSINLNLNDTLLLIILGIVHTGIAYVLFFSSIGSLPAQTSSLLTYIDPVTAILLSALWLHQPLTSSQIIGTILILGSTLTVELWNTRPKNTKTTMD